jgi:tetratricopeptide (TPR) repeat protein
VSPWRRADRVADEADEASNGWLDHAAGLEVYRRATEEHPADAELWLLYGGALAALERWGEAEAVARRGLEAAGFDEDLWVLVLDALVEQGLAELLIRELETPFGRSAHPLIVPVYRARALELRHGDPEALLTALGVAYDQYGDIVRFDHAPRQQVLDLALMLARHGARDEADYCLDTLSRKGVGDDIAWQAAAIGVALWRDVVDETADLYRERLDADDRGDDEIEQAIVDAAAKLDDPTNQSPGMS